MKILIPTDFSENARYAIDFVYRHFKAGQVNISLMHTVKAPASTTGVLIRIDDLMRKDADDAMEKELAYIEQTYGTKPNAIVRFGFLKDWVNREVDEKRVNMVVMGTKGETNLASKMMGSITESMIRHSRVPVLALPPGEDKDSLEHIVIASDDLNESRQEVLLHCLNDMNLLRPRFTYLFVDKGTVSGSLPKSIPLGGHQVAVHIEKNNSVVAGINRYIDQSPTDILVLFHRHNSLFDYLFNRSVTKTICSNTHRPILVIPEKV